MLNIIGAFGATRFRPINPSKQSVISAVNIGKISELQIKFKNGSRSSIWNLAKVEIACMDGNGIRVREIFRTLSGQDRIETDSVVSLKLGILRKFIKAKPFMSKRTVWIVWESRTKAICRKENGSL